MKKLKNKLYQARSRRSRQKKAKLDATKADVSFGSQIRSYVFQPYTMVNDHRTELKIPDVQRIMDGDIDQFIEAYLKQFGAGGSGVTASADRGPELRHAARRESSPRWKRRASRRTPTVRSNASPRRRWRSRRRRTRRARWCASRVGSSPGERTARRCSGTSLTSGPHPAVFPPRCLGDDVFKLVDLFDLGDVIGVAGPLFRTRTGESTVRVDVGDAAGEVASAAAVRQGGDGRRTTRRHSGFADPEQRYRQRYADLAVHPEVRGVPSRGRG